MSRFDEELRAASRRLAAESLPADVMDEALDAPPSRPRWLVTGAVVASAAFVAMVGGAGLSQLAVPATPLPSLTASQAVTPGQSVPPVATCENVAAPAGGEDVVFVFFPCGSEPGSAPVSTARSVPQELSPIERLRAALRGLLDGPTSLERSAGMVQVLPPGSAALLGEIDLASDGLATVDFDPSLAAVSNLSTTATGGAFIQTVRETALGLDEVTAVELRLAGSCDDFFAIFGASCQHLAEPVSDVSDCPIIPPAELPSGAAIGEPRAYPGMPMVSWGSGADTVTESPGHRDSGSPPEGTSVSVRGYPGAVRPTGDLPLPAPFAISWIEEGCPYSVTVALPGGEAAVLDYAARFGPLMTQPSPAPAEPISASAEESGLLLTVTLDRDRTVYGQRVMATATIENVGADTVFWGHSGTCVYPVSVVAEPSATVEVRPGRDDWTGDAAILKEVSIDPPMPSYAFTPEEWLDFEGMWACTTNLVISELAPGEALVQRRGWDTVGQQGMPPPIGAYTVTARFDFMSRGEAPSGSEGVDAFGLKATLPLTVDGPDVDHLSPGEAVDALLSERAFRAELTESPRELWTGSSLTYLDGEWELVLHLRSSRFDADPADALVGTVDARTGIVLDVRREARGSPGG